MASRMGFTPASSQGDQAVPLRDSTHRSGSFAGANPHEVMPAVVQPDPALTIYVCGESFSRGQAWVEGALETVETVTERLLA